MMTSFVASLDAHRVASRLAETSWDLDLGVGVIWACSLNAFQDERSMRQMLNLDRHTEKTGSSVLEGQHVCAHMLFGSVQTGIFLLLPMDHQLAGIHSQ